MIAIKPASMTAKSSIRDIRREQLSASAKLGRLQVRLTEVKSQFWHLRRIIAESVPRDRGRFKQTVCRGLQFGGACVPVSEGLRGFLRMLRRRHFLLGMLLMPSTAVLQDENQILLPKVPARVGVDVLDALRARHSARDFLAKALPLDAVGMVLWAAFGINRPDSRGRTAPSAHGWQEIDIYAALAQGTYRYEPSSHRLDLVFARDVRAQTGLQDFVGQAPLNLIYVADLARMTGADEQDRAFYSATDTGFIAQNVYLACAAGGLATVVRGLVDRKALAAALGLSSTQRIILAQSIGFPRR